MPSDSLHLSRFAGYKGTTFALANPRQRHPSRWNADLKQGQSIKHLTQLAAVFMLLAGTLAVPGCAEQASVADQKQSAYVASAKREPFHKPGCEWARKITRANLEMYKTRDEAIKAGLRPCKVCKP